MIRVTVWNEYFHEKTEDCARAMYPLGLHTHIKSFLSSADVEVRTATLEEECHGLTPEVLNTTDVLLWWGHCKHKDVSDEIVEAVRQRVLEGMGLIVLHSGHRSKIFQRLIGTTGNLTWGREQRGIMWTLLPNHPIAEGLPPSFELYEEMYSEPFYIPNPDEVVFATWFEDGNLFRGGVTYRRGLGKIFYFHPGHETCPSYHNPYVRRVIANAVRFCAPAPLHHEFQPGDCIRQRIPPARALSTAYVGKSALNLALAEHLAAYSDVPKNNDNCGGIIESTTAMTVLALEEYRNPSAGVVRDRLLMHLRHLIAGGNEPYFDAEPYWSYPILTAAIALARRTPTVWSELSAEETERLDLIMRTFLVLGSFCTDDRNDFRTGMALRGNYCKTWNPNYRLANVPQMLFCRDYFGGVAEVDRILSEFDYDTYMEAFRSYGFTRVLARWSTETHEAVMRGEDGTEKTVTVLGARDLLMKGGVAYRYEWRLKGQLTSAGEGVGARPEYRYMGHTLSDTAGIFNELLAYNYSGGPVKNEWSNDQGAKAFLVSGSSPMLGKEGMMRELNTPNRSSAGYCSHDFVMVVAALATLETLGLYSHEEHPALWELVKVGNADLIYKLEQGYSSHATYNTGNHIDVSYEANMPTSYKMMKMLWLKKYQKQGEQQ